MEQLKLKTPKLTIGYSLGALEFALEVDSMLLVNDEQRPPAIPPGHALKRWYEASFELGMRGLLPVPSSPETIRIEDNKAHITTTSQRVIKVEFEELHVFDLDRVHGLATEEKIHIYEVYDWFDIKRGAKQPACSILTPHAFVQKLVFYPSSRHDGNDGRFKDCYSRSYVEPSCLNDFEYSETAAKFAAMKIIRDNGFRGRQQETDGRPYHLNIVLEHSMRDLYKHKKEFIVTTELPPNIHCHSTADKWT